MLESVHQFYAIRMTEVWWKQSINRVMNDCMLISGFVGLILCFNRKYRSKCMIYSWFEIHIAMEYAFWSDTDLLFCPTEMGRVRCGILSDQLEFDCSKYSRVLIGIRRHFVVEYTPMKLKIDGNAVLLRM